MTSLSMAKTFTPAFLMSITVFLRVPAKPVGDWPRAQMTTLAPSPAYSLAVARPSHRMAPVTIATIPSV